MTYKKDKPIIQGTDAHRSALKSLGAKGGAKLAAKLGARAVPGLGWALAAYDVGKLGYYSIKKGSLKEGAKDLGRDYGLSFDDDNKKATTKTSSNLPNSKKKSKESIYRTTPKTDYKKKSKLPTYREAWDANNKGVQSKYGTYKEFEKAAKDWNKKNRK